MLIDGIYLADILPIRILWI